MVDSIYWTSHKGSYLFLSINNFPYTFLYLIISYLHYFGICEIKSVTYYCIEQFLKYQVFLIHSFC